MNDSTDRLSETFEAHEHLAPDAVDVLARANRIARSYQRRRWAVRATGGAVLGAGLVAGGIALPGRAGSSGTSASVTVPADGGSPSPSPSPVTYTQDEDFAAYFAAGYDYDDAVQLAKVWNDSDDIGQVKADAGLKLLEGQTLPVQPSGTPQTPAEKAQSAFFDAGYDYNDAVALGKLWHDSDTAQVKTDAGQKLLAGQTLPIQPGGGKGGSTAYTEKLSKAEKAKEKLAGTSGGATPMAATKQDKEIQAFVTAGYTYDDAVRLGKIWHVADTLQVKADAGRKLIGGQKLPIGP